MSLVLVFDSVLPILWPLCFTAGVWAIAVWALRLPDEQTLILHRLTQAKSPSATAETATASDEAGICASELKSSQEV